MITLICKYIMEIAISGTDPPEIFEKTQQFGRRKIIHKNSTSTLQRHSPEVGHFGRHTSSIIEHKSMVPHVVGHGAILLYEGGIASSCCRHCWRFAERECCCNSGIWRAPVLRHGFSVTRWIPVVVFAFLVGRCSAVLDVRSYRLHYAIYIGVCTI